ncbi:hypothetical protein [Crenobacter intestini]|uniref:Uncharacterized protein n=1 Tax=Crenobacter intestini TaxID=2563443 RepID=A0A4T0UM72_9NEIS|nr:hypothetical protein [Crenobacter intestini]TIC79546.1 hypothetical protein E5K04_13455 [Crenobacter intestini]
MVPYYNSVAVQASFLTAGMLVGIQPDALYQRWAQGALELHDALCRYAEPLYRVNAALSARYAFPGVFEYEVSEALGAWFGCMVEAEGEAPSADRVLQQLAELTIRFMAGGGHGQQALALVSELLPLSGDTLDQLAAIRGH